MKHQSSHHPIDDADLRFTPGTVEFHMARAKRMRSDYARQLVGNAAAACFRKVRALGSAVPLHHDGAEARSMKGV